ncbi:putative ABC transport system permease protein [Paenibacillus phyllosphaerae]|uniref:Putative ABC transport system permease protein n=1 Tax=Paenibacillus phyllosphaerae TaxID=274593 RepID=A0A7W5FRK4_9BACL|nr:ABC transporter permease [Paenibacillus phyllosphaerae]MBB3114625.1 putative ABC transport system permease protein [Paenibacillus phyllosphaerae]
MTVLIMLFRKLARNRWLAISLLAGMLCCIALTSSMPIYKNAVLRYMLVQDMDRSYEQTGNHPGIVSIDITMRDDNPTIQAAIMNRLAAYWASNITDGSLKLQLDQRIMETVRFALTPTDPSRVDAEEKRSAKFSARTGLEEKVRLVDGVLPKKEVVNGVYEVMVTDNALVELKMLLGQEYTIDDPRPDRQPIRVKPVAVIAEQDLSDVYWSRATLGPERNTLFLPEELFNRDFAAEGPFVFAKIGALAAADYTSFDIRTAEFMIGLKSNMAADMLGSYSFSASSSVWVPGSDAMTAYADREQTLRNLLWSLNVPLFILIGFYLYMVTGMLIERQKSEIAVLRSRGATRLHILSIYAMEFGLIAAIALAAGPFLGAGFTRVLGSTSTFLSFVDRGALEVQVSAESWLYAGGAAIVSWIVGLVPVFLATGHSIVDQNRAKAREGKRPAWQTFGLDIVLIGLSFYGYYVFDQRMRDLVKLGLDGKSLSADPLLYTVPTLFILGASLLLIRVYPLIVSCIYRLGRKRWSPQLYSTLLLVSRRNRIYHGLMVFLVLTIGTGIYNANTARTINGNMEDQIWYANGSDIVLRQHWENDAPPASSQGGPDQTIASASRINYLEPPFELLEQLPGVEWAARVFVKEGSDAWLGNKSGKVRLMGIDTDAFGEAAWMKEGLLPHHFYDYLNLMAPDANAVLLSTTAAEHFGAQIGDVMDIGWEGLRPTRFIVYGVVDYFPSFNPNRAASPEETQENLNPMLIIGHLEKIQNELAMEPYEAWIKLSPGADRQKLLEGMEEKGIALESFEDTVGEIAQSRLDPFRMAINGVLSLGFIVSLAISFIGFMLFWLLSLQGRMLQLGIYRAMGISFRQLLGMLIVEQLLTTGAGFLIAIATGWAACRIFVPLNQLSFDPGTIVPPFDVISDNADIVRLAVATCFMLAAALVILAWLLKRMNVYQAVKLGED